MKKILPLILILLLLIFAGSAFADSNSSSPHRAVLGSGKIYLMYDLETGALCYITSMGGIHCSHHMNYAISRRVLDLLNAETKKYQSRKNNPPHMILIDFPVEIEVEIKPQKEENKTYLKQGPINQKEEGKEDKKL